jgi:translocation and assembly module TamA
MRLGALLLATALAGCAALPETAPAPAAPDQGGAAAPVPSSVSGLDVEAPAELKTLLERYLDLARVNVLASGELIDESEWSRLIDAAPAQVRELLQTEGYFDPQVTLSRESATDTAQRRVRLVLEPGVRTVVSKVTLDVQGELEQNASAGDEFAKNTLAGLRGSWGLPAGEPFRNPAWNNAKVAALARLRASGYAAANWSGTGAEIDADEHQARLFMVADSGPLFRYGALDVEGLVAHDMATVRVLANFPIGTPVSEQLLLDYQERLQKSGLFDSISVTLDPDPEKAAQAHIVVRLREAPLQVWTWGLGVSANTGPRASVEHLYRRVFGFAATARNKLEVGRLRQAWDGEISTHPSNDLYRNLLGGTVERLVSDSDVVLSQRVRIGRSQDTQRIERFYYLQGERSQRVTLGDNSVRTNTTAVSVNYNLVWRQLDSVVLPTEGITMNLQPGFGRAHGTDAASGWFSHLYGRFTGYLPLGRTWYGQARLELGQVIKHQDVAVPESQLFRAGGDDSVRGYSYRSLGPTVDGVVSGGNSLLTTSFEVARPISASMPSLWGALFVDYGGAANSFHELKPSLGPGFGLRWRSPVGPLRLDLAYGNDLKAWRLHFSVGIAF